MEIESHLPLAVPSIGEMKTVIGEGVMSFLTHIMNSPLLSLTVTEEAPNPTVTAEKYYSLLNYERIQEVR